MAVADLHELIVSRSLPSTARARVRKRLAQLKDFPESGVKLDGRWAPARALRGPWPRMVHVYHFDAATDVVTILAIQDTRTSSVP